MLMTEFTHVHALQRLGMVIIPLSTITIATLSLFFQFVRCNHVFVINACALSGPCTLAVFVPSIKGAPASVRLYSERDFTRPLCNKSFFKAEKITIFWNPQVRAFALS